MTTRTLAIVLLRLWGLVSLVRGATFIISTALVPIGLQGQREMLRVALLMNGLTAVTLLALGAALFLAAPRIAGWIDPQPEEGSAPAAAAVGIQELQTVVFGALGAYFLLVALREIAELLYAIARHPAWDESGSFAAAFQQRQADLAGAVVQLIAAAILLVNSASLAAAWARVRGGDRRQDESES